MSLLFLAKVAVPVPLGQAFSYLVPSEIESNLARGMRVVVPFGRRKCLGVVLDFGLREPEIAEEKLKPILATVGDEAALPPELLDFLLELARYYFSPIGEVLRLALPAVERTLEHKLKQQDLLSGLKLTAVGRVLQVAARTEAPLDGLVFKGQAREIALHLEAHGPTPINELSQTWRNARAAVKKLVQLGLVRLEEREGDVDPFFKLPVKRDQPPRLNAEQAAAVEAISQKLSAGERQAFLLDGVTASGKTEVYLHAVAACLESGGSALVLVPEIALTPQLVSRFRARLGDAVAVWHSELSEPARLGMWRALRRGELRVVVGARSALFAPVTNLRLICVDEEHDGSFKQEEGVRYHARDMALLRAHRAQAVCVLGSATPSLASEFGVRTERLQRLKLPARARTDSRLPKIEIVDLKRMGAGPSGERLLSLPLHRALETVLAAKQQAILFLNRRGFAPSLICEGCGEVQACPNCEVALTVHRAKGDRVQCHYCDYSAPEPVQCGACKGTRLMIEGVGTERIEQALQETFPDARIARLDRDVAAGVKSEKVLDRVRNGDVDILVGTQMVTKGHDLPNVTLVGVLNADAALSLPDFRAAERTFQLLVQVAGRAGRGGAPGTVLIQTRQPEHPAVHLACQNNVQGFVERELSERQELNYPPYSRLAMIRLDAVEREPLRAASDLVARVARGAATSDVEVLGPAPAPLLRLRNRFRYRLLLKSAQRAALRQVLLAVARTTLDRRVRVAIDVDPISML